MIIVRVADITREMCSGAHIPLGNTYHCNTGVRENCMDELDTYTGVNCDKPYLTGLGVWGLAIDGALERSSWLDQSCHFLRRHVI